MIDDLGKLDLLTVLIHELGWVLGREAGFGDDVAEGQSRKFES